MITSGRTVEKLANNLWIGADTEVSVSSRMGTNVGAVCRSPGEQMTLTDVQQKRVAP